MAYRPDQARLNPTLFDKLVAGNEIGGLRGSEVDGLEQRRSAMRVLSIEEVERFNERLLRATVRRELGWLLNIVNFESGTDLSEAPNVRTSVLNYGVPDLAGKSFNSSSMLQRARQIRAAIQAFEPRIDPASLDVELSSKVERENAVTFVIHADIRTAVRAIPVELRTDIEADTAAATVRE